MSKHARDLVKDERGARDTRQDPRARGLAAEQRDRPADEAAANVGRDRADRHHQRYSPATSATRPAPSASAMCLLTEMREPERNERGESSTR